MTVAVLFPTVSFHYESKTFVGAEERAECAEVVEQGKCIYIYIYICVLGWIGCSLGGQYGFYTTLLIYRVRTWVSLQKEGISCRGVSCSIC